MKQKKKGKYSLGSGKYHPNICFPTCRLMGVRGIRWVLRVLYITLLYVCVCDSTIFHMDKETFPDSQQNDVKQ